MKQQIRSEAGDGLRKEGAVLGLCCSSRRLVLPVTAGHLQFANGITQIHEAAVKREGKTSLADVLGNCNINSD